MKVFLSSTALDLRAHRKVADDTILRLSQDAIVMERFGALPGTPVAECERMARESEVVVCVVAHRYGHVPEKGKGSITRREVEAAHAAGKHVLVWIVADDHPWTEAKEQDLLTDPAVQADRARTADVLEGIRALGAFKTWLRATFTVDTFTTPDDLGRKLAIALRAQAPGHAPNVARPAPKRGEIRIVHALQPAPHFHGRDALVKELTDWVADLASPDRVWSLVAAGGTGKTAIVERVGRDMQPSEANVLVWSFYERPDADAFLRECNQLFLGEDEGPAGGRLERLERGLRDGRPHLIVLDGLERVQEEAGNGRVRGELSDQTLKLLLRGLAAGLGRARALVTSRFPLVDLHDWTNRGYRQTQLDDLTPEAAVAVLRGWDVKGDDAELRAVATQVGNHALSVAVIGSYLRSFASGDVRAVATFDLDAVTGEDPKAAKLARMLAFYAEQLPGEERELLARLSVFPRGVTLELMGVVINAGGDVAGMLVNARPRLLQLLGTLRKRGLVFEYRDGAVITWTAHPFLRESFRELLACPVERVFDAVAGALGAGLEARPANYPTDSAMLDRYEQLIEATRLAGREEEAFKLYWYGLGHYEHLAKALGEYQRGYRIVAAFQPAPPGRRMLSRSQSILANDLSLFANRLGRLNEASEIEYVADEWHIRLGDSHLASNGLQNSARIAFARGRLTHALDYANAALAQARRANNQDYEEFAYADRGSANHAMGEVGAATEGFSAAIRVAGGPLYSLRGAQYARCLVDKGEYAAARFVCDECLKRVGRRTFETPWFHALMARIALAAGGNPTPHLEEIRRWTSRTGDMQSIIEAHLLAALHLIATGDPQSALSEAETGLLHAESCGYGLLRIELLVALARIRLVWPDPPRAIQTARKALDLATHPECQYAWGEADAAQVWGEAYAANHEPTLALRAFDRALAVRRRIEHPRVAETENWISRLT